MSCAARWKADCALMLFSSILELFCKASVDFYLKFRKTHSRYLSQKHPGLCDSVTVFPKWWCRKKKSWAFSFIVESNFGCWERWDRVCNIYFLAVNYQFTLKYESLGAFTKNNLFQMKMCLHFLSYFSDSKMQIGRFGTTPQF